MKDWSPDTKKDAFARMVYASISRIGPSPNLFFPDLGVFAQEIAMHSVVQEGSGHYAYGHEA